MNYHKNQDYFTRSFLVNFLKSPLHAITELNAEETTSPALLFGQAYHSLIAGTFLDEYFVFDEVNRPEADKSMASNANKAWKQALQMQGKQLIPVDTFVQLSEMHARLSSNDLVQRMQAFKYVQEEVFTSEIEGFKLKCKPDCILQERSLIVDWKTTADLPVNDYQAERIIRKYNYHFQAAMYCEVCKMDYFLFFFQEKTAPFDVVPVLIRKESPLMKEGAELWRMCAKMAKECQERGEWPGVANGLKDGCITL